MKTVTEIKNQKRITRHIRIRAKISGTAERPRLSVFRSNKHIHAQLIDDDAGKTLVAISTDSVKGVKMVEKAKIAGKTLATAAVKQKITSAVFDRGGFLFTGRVKAFAEGAREGGLKF